MKKAFTLIELLVVVLIIGILAAVALPQYEMAVLKSKLTGMLPFARHIVDAQERYYMANSSYTVNMENLDIDIPSDSILNEKSSLKFGNDFLIHNSGSGNNSNGYLGISYCPGYNTGYTSCTNNALARINWYFDHHATNPGKRVCQGYNSSSKGTKLCKLFAGWTTN